MTLRRWAGLAFALFFLTFMAALITWVAWRLFHELGERSKRPIASTAPSAASAPGQWPDAPRELALDLGGGVTLKLALIPAGRFVMGSGEKEEDSAKDERPQRTVEITRAFHMGAFEVTQGQYRRITGKDPSHFREGGEDLPAERVSWEDATAFCKALSGKSGQTVRLPTEAEWEYACRAGSTTRFFYGDDEKYHHLGEYAWAGRFTAPNTHPVGQRKPNPWGLYDIYGNVAEWCFDWYAKDYKGAAKEDPQGPPEPKKEPGGQKGFWGLLGTDKDPEKLRVVRGGSWHDSAWSCRSATRNRLDPAYKAANVGFRVVVDLK